jgi:hypothetical protein
MPSAKISEYNVDLYRVKINDGGTVDFRAGDGLTPATTGTFNFYGNLNVVGTTTTLDSQDLNITDNVIVLNNGETGNGVTLNTAGFIIDRGNFPDAKLLYDEDVTWYDSRTGGVDANKGGWVFKDNNNQTIGIFTNFVGTFADDDLVLLGEGQNVVSVRGTVSYEKQLWPYSGDDITPNVNLEDRLSAPYDDDAIPNIRAVKDYVKAYNAYNFTDTIESGDTTVSVADQDETSSQSLAMITVDSSEVAKFYQASIELLEVKIETNRISTINLNSNVVIEGTGTGSVEFGTPALFPKITDPVAPSDGVKIYAKTEADGGTGIYFINENSTQDEIISRNKALLYSIIF